MISGIVISFTGWYFIDPIIGIVIAIVILVSTWELLSESLRMSMDAVPESIDSEAVIKAVNEMPGVTEVHHVHIWPISTTQTAMTAHIVIPEGGDPEATVLKVKECLKGMGIGHATIETEREGHSCGEHDCC